MAKNTKILTKKILLILVLFFTLPLVSASLTVQINSDRGNAPSIPSTHGQSKDVVFTINAIEDGFSCASPVYCSYQLLKEHTISVLLGDKTTYTGSSFTVIARLQAPTKEEARLDSSTVPYELRVYCRRDTNLLCLKGTPIDNTQMFSITLNYDLTSQERDAKNYVYSSLNSMSSFLKSAESSISYTNSKMATIPKNVLISDLKSQLSVYSNDYNKYKAIYDKVNGLYTALGNTGYYIEAKNSYDPNVINQITTLKNGVELLNKNIDERIKLHNQVTDDLNKLKDNLAKIEIKTKLLNQDISGISSQVNTLSSQFESGTFSSYTEVQNSISSLNSQIGSISDKLSASISDVIAKGNKIILLERAKLSDGNKYSVSAKSDVGSIKEECDQLNAIKSDFERLNYEQSADYTNTMNEINDYNNNLEIINSRISEINQIRKSVSRIVNKDNIKDKEFSSCQNELSKISEFDYTQLRNIDYNSYQACLDLNKSLSEIQKEREKAFSFRIIRFFRTFLFESIKFKEIKELNKRELPKELSSLLDFDSDSKKFSTDYCNIDLTLSVKKTEYVNNVIGTISTNSNVGNITIHQNQCCDFGICTKCCENNECSNDVGSYPVIFLHGHSFKEATSPDYSLDAFNKIQIALLNDKYKTGGIVLPSDQYAGMVQGEWGRTKFPITVKATYYLDVYNSEGKIVNAPQKQDSIDIYAQRLKNVVDYVKYRTGRNKVIIIAHSMGGLVARDYIENQGGDSSVYKLIMIGTPNHGINGLVDSLCSVLGANTECAQMSSNSTFINHLNAKGETYGVVKYYTMAGSGCVLSLGDGDGISIVQSVQLSGATNVLVSGKCEGITAPLNPYNKDFHSNLLDPDKYPETLDYIRQFLKE